MIPLFPVTYTAQTGPRLPYTINVTGLNTVQQYESTIFPQALNLKQLIVSSLYNIIRTRPGERVMNPSFGCNLEGIMFEPISSGLGPIGSTLIQQAITNFEPRVTVKSITFTQDETTQSLSWNVQLVANQNPTDVLNFTIQQASSQ